MDNIQGKHFSITDPKGVKTVIYQVNKTEKEFLKEYPKYTVERLEHTEELRGDFNKKTFYVENPSKDGNRLVILSFGEDKVVINTGILLNDEVKIEPEKEPQQPIDFYAVRGDTIKEEIQKKYEDKAKTEMFTIPEEIKKEVSKEEKVPVDTSSVVVGNNVVTDDQYFDDFFGDE